MSPRRLSAFLMGLILACTRRDGDVVTRAFLRKAYKGRALSNGFDEEQSSNNLKKDIKALEDAGLVARRGHDFIEVIDTDGLWDEIDKILAHRESLLQQEDE